eukprot:PhF_6_TR41035/c0_g1_i3/m.62156
MFNPQDTYDSNDRDTMTKMLNELGIDNDFFPELISDPTSYYVRDLFKKALLSGPESQTTTVARCRSAKEFYDKMSSLDGDFEMVRTANKTTLYDNTNETQIDANITLYKNRSSGEGFFVAKSSETDANNAIPTDKTVQVGTWDGTDDSITLKVVVTKKEYFLFDQSPLISI